MHNFDTAPVHINSIRTPHQDTNAHFTKIQHYLENVLSRTSDLSILAGIDTKCKYFSCSHQSHKSDKGMWNTANLITNIMKMMQFNISMIKDK